MDPIKTKDLERYLAIMHELADLSEQMIRPYFRKKLSVDDKKGKEFYDPVTDADRNSEQAIRNYIEAHLPDHSVIGEEFGTLDRASDYCWIIDPIDGTRAFIMGSPLWGTLIGLSYKNTPIMGMMNQPFTFERYWGVPEGAFGRWSGEDHALSTGKTTELSDAVITTTCPDLFAQDDDLRAFERLRHKCRMTRFGGDCYSFCLLAMGGVDLVVETGLMNFDIAPLIPIVRGAGGVVSNWQGGDAAHGGQIIAAATAELHEAALAELTAVS